jgi:uncharacterized protein (DUF1810 family)
MDDPWRLDRYVTAQERGGTYQRAVAELRAGAKVSHWMWFVFPQIAGLGMSAMSREYAISSIAEARAYLDHPVLGPRLVECAGIVAGTEGRSAEQIFGPVDAMKLRSSMTLFAAADMAAASVDDGGTSVNEGGTGGAAASGGEGQAPDESRGNVFRAVLAKFFGGAADEATLARLLRHRRPRHEDGSVARRRLGRPQTVGGTVQIVLPSLVGIEVDKLRAERGEPPGRLLADPAGGPGHQARLTRHRFHAASRHGSRHHASRSRPAVPADARRGRPPDTTINFLARPRLNAIYLINKGRESAGCRV